jgi:CelD/BcsL family acetyltransferase involved in cellulose biosynthesis
MMYGVLVDDVEKLEPYRHAWDELAVSRSMPYCSPAWMLSWWRHVAPPQALLRTVLVLDGKDLVAVAPFFIDRGVGGLIRCRLLGARTSSRVDFLVAAGLEREVAAIVVELVDSSEPPPDLIMLEGVATNRDWPRLMKELWPGGRMRIYRQFTQAAPLVSLNVRTYDDWFQSKSHHFRKSMRRSLRQLEATGARIRLANDPIEIRRELESFARLHYQRWKTRGGSSVLNQRVQRMLEDASAELIGQLRFRLWSIEVEGETISSHVFLSAGGETAYWLGGFDERWSRLEPSILAILGALRHAFSVGDRRLDLGAGGQTYKYRFSDGEDQLEWVLLVRSGLKAPLARSQMLARRTRMMLAQRLSPSAKRLVRSALRFVAGLKRST